MATSKKPPEISMALAALKTLEAKGCDEYSILKKSLPILAAKLKKSGQRVSKKLLLEQAEKGADFIAGEIKRLASLNSKQSTVKSYEDIVAALPAYKGPELTEEQKARKAFLQACGTNDLEALKQVNKTHLDLATINQGGIRASLPGHLNIVRHLHSLGGDLNANQGEPLRLAAISGNFELVEYMYKHADGPLIGQSDALTWATYGDNIDVVKYIHKQGIDFVTGEYGTLHSAAKNGSVKSLRYMGEYGVDLHVNNDEALRLVAKSDRDNRFEAFKYLHEQGADIHANDDEAFLSAAKCGDVALVKYMHESGVDITQLKNHALYLAIKHGHDDLRDYFTSHGLSEANMIAEQVTDLFRAHKWSEIRMAHVIEHADLESDAPDESPKATMPSKQLWLDNPHYFKADIFWPLYALIEKEKLWSGQTELLSFKATALFGREDKLLRYLEKWGEKGRAPLHNLMWGLEIPKQGRSDFKAWSDALMQHGPKMAGLVKYADHCPVPLRSECGRSVSYEKTADKIAMSVYESANDHPDLARFCFKKGWLSTYFKEAVDQLDKYEALYADNGGVKPNNRIPDIKINGKRFGKEGYRFYKLPDGDARGLVLGEHVNNCQHLASTGASCAKHGFLSEQGGFYVVAKEDSDEIVAESWAWRGKKGEIVFDSLESLGDRMDNEEWLNLTKCLSYQFKKHADITAFYVGTGGGTPNIGLKTLKKDDNAYPIDHENYSDAKEAQYRVFKRRVARALSS